jgi:hypothetical protein
MREGGLVPRELGVVAIGADLGADPRFQPILAACLVPRLRPMVVPRGVVAAESVYFRQVSPPAADQRRA